MQEQMPRADSVLTVLGVPRSNSPVVVQNLGFGAEGLGGLPALPLTAVCFQTSGLPSSCRGSSQSCSGDELRHAMQMLTRARVGRKHSCAVCYCLMIPHWSPSVWHLLCSAML